MSQLPALSRRLLDLAVSDRASAVRELSQLAPAEQAALICETPLASRARVLDLLTDPERVVPELPEAELCFTAKAIGLADAGWFLALASADQIQACLDLDAWEDQLPSRTGIGNWLTSLAVAGDEALERGGRALDPELLMLWLADRLSVVQKPDDDQGFEPPEGGHTIEGQFFLVAHRPDDDLAEPLRLLSLLFQSDYWFYFRLVQAVLCETPIDNEEWALRWRTGRLQDLGFPEWGEAATLYARPRAADLDDWPDAPSGIGLLGKMPGDTLGNWELPVWIPRLPEGLDPHLAILEAAGQLDESARRPFLYAFVALANKVAVADRLPLGDAESLPRCLEKAARLASAGLVNLAGRHGVGGPEVLRRVPLGRLFRIGASLDRGETAP